MTVFRHSYFHNASLLCRSYIISLRISSNILPLRAGSHEP